MSMTPAQIAELRKNAIRVEIARQFDWSAECILRGAREIRSKDPDMKRIRETVKFINTSLTDLLDLLEADGV